ncbi:MAG: lysophospholipid acyltransferase family protein [Bdellovibrionaceae bacterium]|nr:lysophospholipid acyltransferase family protein [Pseudobdellovibrionaceae bacterium]
MKMGMKLLGVSELLRMYKDNEQEIAENGPWTTGIRLLNLSINVHPDQLNHIPAEGPLVIVSNHPFGGADGIVLSYLVEQRRKDLKVFVTNMLSEQLPAAKPYFLDVELYGDSHQHKARNQQAVSAAIDYVKNGGALVIFPAGTPAQAHTPFGEAEDLPWKTGAAKIIQESKAPVIPVFFEGQNSVFFQSVGIFFSRFKSARTLLLAKELLNKKNKEISVRIGSKIPFSNIENFSLHETLKFLRARVHLLKHETQPRGPSQKAMAKFKSTIPYKLRKSTKVHDIIEPIPTPKLNKFLTQYVEENPDALLIDSKKYKVFLLDGSKTSESFLMEIGRLREVTFRAAGEGSGKRCDLDEHDSIYHHLIVWNDQKQWISGSYRIGLTPYVLPKRGVRGFYCHPFFNLQESFFNKLGDAVELGRSFVRKEEQSQWILFFLWKGIAKFLLDNPNYKYLFGSVSISDEYSERSRVLMARYFYDKTVDDEGLKELAHPAIPFDYESSLTDEEIRLILNNIQDVSELSKIISDIEEDHKHIPVLVYRYAELGAKYLCFSVDPDFGNTLDGFITVKIKDIPREQIKKYLAEEQLDRFYQR